MSRNKSRVLSISIIFTLLVMLCASCITANQSLGSVYVPKDRDLKVRTVSFAVPVGMKMADTLQTTTSFPLIGNIYDDFYGLTNAEFAGTVTPPDTIPWGKDPKFVSARMQFVLSSIQTFADGQEAIPQNFHAYELLVPMDTTKIYCNSIERTDYSTYEIGKGAVIYTAGDTLTIPLKDEYASKFMDATKEELDSAALFIQHFYGIYLKSDLKIQNGVAGGRLNKFKSAHILFTYNSTNDAGVKRDTTVSFPVGTSYGTDIYTHSSRGMEVDGNNNLETIYYEGLAGIKPHIDANALKDSMMVWIKKEDIDISKILIARASLELPYEAPADYEELNGYPASLYPCTRYKFAYNADQYYPLSAIYDTSLDRGDINRSLQYYKPDVTLYIQDILGQIASKKEGEPLNSSWDLWLFDYYDGTDDVEEEEEDTSNSAYNSMYMNYLYNSMLYGGYGGYGGYGYGGYGYGYGGYGYGGYGSDYYDYYNMMNYYNYYNSASSSSSSSEEATVYYVDFINYCRGKINGNGAARHPVMHITYTTVED